MQLVTRQRLACARPRGASRQPARATPLLRVGVCSASKSAFPPSISADRGFLPSADPIERLQLARTNPAAAEWEDTLSRLPNLAVAAQVAGGAGGGGGAGTGSSVGLLRKAIAALPPFPLTELLAGEREPPPGHHPPSDDPLQGDQHPGAPPPPTATTPGFRSEPPPEPSLHASAASTSAAEDDRFRAACEAAAAAAGVRGPLPHGGSAELWRAYMLLSFMANAYVWCEPGEAAAVLPARVAVPWVTLAVALGMPPVLTYAAYNLCNWRRLDPAAPPHLGNLVSLQNFLVCPDEEWFRLVHIDVEARAAAAVAGLLPMQQAAARGDAAAVAAGLRTITAALRGMQRTMARMGEQCDPYVYFQRLRRPMSGWRNNPLLPQGLIYEGVYDKPVQLYGATGAQSSVVPALDRALGILHQEGHMREYLAAMTQHMPPAHRDLLHRLEAANAVEPRTAATATASSGTIASDSAAACVSSSSTSSTGTGTSSSPGGSSSTEVSGANVRVFVMSYRDCAGSGAGTVGAVELRQAYDEAVGELVRFRSVHRGMAASYIMQQQQQQQQQVGTAAAVAAGAAGAAARGTAAGGVEAAAGPRGHGKEHAHDTAAAAAVGHAHGAAAHQLGSLAPPGHLAHTQPGPQAAHAPAPHASAPHASAASDAAAASAPAPMPAAGMPASPAAHSPAVPPTPAARHPAPSRPGAVRKHVRLSAARGSGPRTGGRVVPGGGGVGPCEGAVGSGSASSGEDGEVVLQEAAAALGGGGGADAAAAAPDAVEVGEVVVVGTGGSNVLPALTTFRDTTTKHLLARAPLSRTPPPPAGGAPPARAAGA